MFTVTIVNILALFFSILDSVKYLRNGLKYSFILITLIAAIRYDYGNDYMSYFRDFNRVGDYSLGYIIENQKQLQYSDAVFKDLGAVIIFRIFNPLGFFIFAGLISTLQGWIYYHFIKENVQRQYYWISLFLYVFQFEFYLLPMSMIRQGISIALFVWSWHFIKQRKIIIPIILAIVSISIHKSAIVFLPFMVLAYYSIKNSTVISIILALGAIFMFVSSSLINLIFDKIAGGELFSIYLSSYGDDNESGRMGLIRMLLAFIPFVLALNYIRKDNVSVHTKSLMVISTIGVLILPFTSIIALVSRLCYYFNIFTIATIPMSIKIIKNPIIRISVIGIILLCTGYQYYDIFLHSVYTSRFINYHTIFTLL